MGNRSMEHVRGAMELAEKMIRMADLVVSCSDDEGCLVIYGVIKDCGFKIKEAIQQELQAVKNRNAKTQKRG